MRYWLVVIAAVLGCAVASYAQDVSPQDQAFFQNQVAKLLKVEPQRIEGLAVNQVFQGPVYKLSVTIRSSGGDQGFSILVVRRGQKLVEISSPPTTQGMPELKSVLKPDFKLRNNKDARVLQEALDSVYPISSDFGGEDLKAKAIKHSGDQWQFIRGKFFEHHKGFVFKTAPDGTITSVSYSLDLP